MLVWGKFGVLEPLVPPESPSLWDLAVEFLRPLGRDWLHLTGKYTEDRVSVFLPRAMEAKTLSGKLEHLGTVSLKLEAGRA